MMSELQVWEFEKCQRNSCELLSVFGEIRITTTKLLLNAAGERKRERNRGKG